MLRGGGSRIPPRGDAGKLCPVNRSTFKELSGINYLKVDLPASL